MNMKKGRNEKFEQIEADRSRIDWMITLVPFVLIVVLALLFFLLPDTSNAVLGSIRTFLGTASGCTIF